jgi:3D (Asp-Asp-Asp) domain-containing protein
MKIWSKISKMPEARVKTALIVFGLLITLAPALGLIGQHDESANNQKSLFEEDRLAVLGDSSILPISDPGAPEPKVVKTMSVVITAYSSTVSQTDSTPFITASNKRVRDGIIANNLLPFGTKIRIPELYGDKIFTVEDRMNSSKGNYHVDIWFTSYNEAKEFGAQRSYIEVLEI